MDDIAHQKFTSVSNRLILQNLQSLSQRGHTIIVRVPVIPGITDTDENIRQIGAFVAALPQLHPVELLPYHHIATDKYQRLQTAYRLPETQPPAPERMSHVAELLRQFKLPVKF
jgi:pyruvate formate lyase activating enzyme